ncbi:MAG TPA: ATP-binding protein [Candidatus Acidoferrales bacterium]|nr:ATP-binding protein [Candidatus Acidoferrales bacterium]
MRIPPDPSYATNVRDAIIAFASLHGVFEADREALLFAVGEALANALEHGAPASDIRVMLEIDETLIRARIVDEGQGWRAIPSGYVHLPDPCAERGRGVAIMQRFMDLFEVQSTAGGGTVVSLGRFRRDRRPGDQERTAAS